MLKNYLKIAIRNLLRFKAYSIVNLLGLSIGLTIGVLILLFVTDELFLNNSLTCGMEYRVIEVCLINFLFS